VRCGSTSRRCEQPRGDDAALWRKVTVQEEIGGESEAAVAARPGKDAAVGIAPWFNEELIKGGDHARR
jgi:hypothetical protein